MKIKVCGMRVPSNVEAVCGTRPDFLGYIFVKESSRYVGPHPDPAIFRIPPPEISRVGVFVNEEKDKVLRMHTECRLDMVQLHGSESPEYCRVLKEEGINVIKAFRPDSLAYSGIPEQYRESVTYYLFDSPGKQHGGTGRKFDWELLDGARIPAPFLLSGGIGPEDLHAIMGLEHPSFAGIDINSRFEVSPGVKDVKLLKVFMEAIRNFKST